MKVIITGGGTAGHVTPLLAVTSELKILDSNIKIRYIGQVGDPMKDMIIKHQEIDKTYSIFAGKWRRYHGIGFWHHLIDVKTNLKNIRDLFLFIIGFFQSFFILLIWRPKVVFVKGGFVGLPVGLAAALLRIPIVTHDSDSIPGLTNRLLSRFAKLHAVGLSERLYSKYYPKEKIRFTGVPIERKYWNVQDNGAIKKEFKINKNNKVVTVIGGSLGAVRMNNAIIKIVHDLTNKNNIHIVWVTGRGQHREIDNKISITDKKINNLSIFSFSSELHKLIAIADLVVSRAGASSIAELAALSKPTIIVPNPNLAGGHQLINAYALKDESAAVVLEEERLMDNPYTLYDLIIKILDDNKLSQKLSVNIHKLSKKDASNAIAKVIIEATN